MLRLLAITATLGGLIGSTFVSGLPTTKRLTFKQRLALKLSNSTTSTSNCIPSFGSEDAMYNIFASRNESAVWEWIPDFYSGDASQGGTVFVSGTDSPEDGAYYFLPTPLPSSDNSTSTSINMTSFTATTSIGYRLNLADQPRGQHCIVAQDGRTMTTGSCENDDSIFLVTCTNCSSTSTKLGSTCRIRSVVPAISSSYCTSWSASTTSIPGVPGYGPVSLRPCKDGMKGQEWDIVVAQ